MNPLLGRLQDRAQRLPGRRSRIALDRLDYPSGTADGSMGPQTSQAIRDYRKAHPRSKPKEIAADLEQQGVIVSSQFVSTVLSTSKRKKSIRKPGRPKSSKRRKKKANSTRHVPRAA